jgi:hypothetical protein
VQQTVAENVNKRLEKGLDELKEKHRKGTNEIDEPDRAPTGQAYQMIDQQRRQLAAQHAAQQQHQQQEEQQRSEEMQALRQHVQDQLKHDDGNDDDSDYDYLLDDDGIDDDPMLDELRQKRLEEMKKLQMIKAENLAKGHGQYRTISQDEFLPECTGSSEWIAVHFFHKEFQRCHIMDHHLKIIAPQHLTCKFLRIDAENAPFFVAKLQVKALPTLLIFREGKAVERLTGFEGLSNDPMKDPDKWKTSKLQKWLASTGAIVYTPSVEELQEEMRRLGVRPNKGTVYRGGIELFDDDC